MSVEQLVRQIHDSGARFVLAVAGGGAGAVADLLAVPGASRSVLAAAVPYAPAAMADWLGGPPDQYCAAPTARAMAMAAFLRACRYDPSEARRAGVGCTASLATDRPKRGPHRVHLAAQTAEATVAWSLELAKGSRSRADEERLVANLLLNLIAETCGLASRLPVELGEGEQVQQTAILAPEPWRELLLGRVEAVCHCWPQGKQCARVAEDTASAKQWHTLAAKQWHTLAAPAAGRVIFPGAFHPLHTGHRRMAQLAGERLGAPVEFEISILNVDKPPLDYLELDRRIKQFAADQTVWLTRAPTFVEKSRRFPGATFVVGADTLRRIADPRYYGHDAAACRRALDEIAAQGCRFLVFGRVADDRFLRVEDLALPDVLRWLCEEIPAEQFREDICSTELRERGEGV